MERSLAQCSACNLPGLGKGDALGPCWCQHGPLRAAVLARWRLRGKRHQVPARRPAAGERLTPSRRQPGVAIGRASRCPPGNWPTAGTAQREGPKPGFRPHPTTILVALRHGGPSRTESGGQPQHPGRHGDGPSGCPGRRLSRLLRCRLGRAPWARSLPGKRPGPSLGPVRWYYRRAAPWRVSLSAVGRLGHVALEPDSVLRVSDPVAGAEWNAGVGVCQGLGAQPGMAASLDLRHPGVGVDGSLPRLPGWAARRRGIRPGGGHQYRCWPRTMALGGAGVSRGGAAQTAGHPAPDSSLVGSRGQGARSPAVRSRRSGDCLRGAGRPSDGLAARADAGLDSPRDGLRTGRWQGSIRARGTVRAGSRRTFIMAPQHRLDQPSHRWPGGWRAGGDGSRRPRADAGPRRQWVAHHSGRVGSASSPWDLDAGHSLRPQL